MEPAIPLATEEESLWPLLPQLLSAVIFVVSITDEKLNELATTCRTRVKNVEARNQGVHRCRCDLVHSVFAITHVEHHFTTTVSRCDRNVSVSLLLPPRRDDIGW